MIAVLASHSTALDTGSTTGVGLAEGAGMLVTMSLLRDPASLAFSGAS
jgi:hypothetical protein